MFNFITHVGVMFAAILLMACNAPIDNASPQVAELIATTPPTITSTSAPTVSIATPTATKVSQTATPAPTATRAPTNTPTVTPTPILHIVEVGETLFSLAFAHDTTVAELAKINQVDENDFLQIGQTLILPAPPLTEAQAIVATRILTLTPVVQLVITPTAAITMTTLSSPQTTAIQSQSVATVVPSAATPLPSGPPPPNISHAANVNPLTGLAVADASTLQRRPILIRIGNDVGARGYQSGFNQAEIVYEEIAEWGVTRFTAIFLTETPQIVAPIRSARLINVQLAPQYQGALSHSGGSDPVRWEISQTPNMVNLDEFYHAAPYFYRPNQDWRTRLAVDVTAIRSYMTAQETEAAVTLQGFNFADAPPMGQAAPDIFIPYPNSTSFTEWHYDTARAKYLRWILGAPLVDSNDGLQVSAANVIIYFADHQATDIKEDSTGATSIRILVNGRGVAWFFRDGILTKGFWQTDGSRPPYFTDETGQPYNLKPGNTWVEVVPTYYTIGLNSADEAKSK